MSKFQKTGERVQRKVKEKTCMEPHFFSKISKLIIVAISMSGITTSSYAQQSVAVVQDDINPKDRDTDTQQIITAINNQTTAISEMIQKLSGQNTINQQTAVKAQSQMMDAWDARETTRRITDWRMRGAIAANPSLSVCNVVTGSVTAKDGFSAANKWQHEITNQQLDFFMGASPNTAAATGAAAAAEQRNSLHCQVAATQYDISRGICPPGTPVQTTQAIDGGGTINTTVGGDLNAETLLNPPELTMNTNEKAEANAFIVHAFEGDAIGALPQNVGSTTVGRQQVAENMTSVARNSVADVVASAILADRAAMPGTGGTGGAPPPSSASPMAAGNTVTGSSTPGQITTSMAAWAEQTAENTIGYQQSNNFPNGLSRVAYLKLRAMAWFWNPNWIMSVGYHDSETNIKDIAIIEAYQVYQNWELYQQIERMNLTLATLLAIMEADHRS